MSCVEEQLKKTKEDADLSEILSTLEEVAGYIKDTVDSQAVLSALFAGIFVEVYGIRLTNFLIREEVPLPPYDRTVVGVAYKCVIEKKMSPLFLSETLLEISRKKDLVSGFVSLKSASYRALKQEPFETGFNPNHQPLFLSEL